MRSPSVDITRVVHIKTAKPNSFLENFTEKTEQNCKLYRAGKKAATTKITFIITVVAEKKKNMK